MPSGEGSTMPGPPFDNPAADIILRSSDNVDFRVRSAILAEASLIFSDMFAVPQPDCGQGLDDSADYVDGKPVVQLEEDSGALDHLLRLCYPVRDPDLSTLEDMRPVLRAAMKYEMDEATELLKVKLRNFFKTRPPEAWATACILGLESDAMQMAAVPRKKTIPEYPPEVFNDLSAGAYFRLLKYHRCRSAVDENFKFCEPDERDLVPAEPSYISFDKHNPPVFVERPFADLICRASDGAEIRTHKVIIATASRLLSDRILLLKSDACRSQSSSVHGRVDRGEQDALPVLELDSPVEDLSVVLELCYPANRGFHHGLGQFSLGRLVALTHCARKHGITMVENVIRSSYQSNIRTYPLKAYLLATSIGLNDLAEDALLRMSGNESEPCTYRWLPELEAVPTRLYHRILARHAARQRPKFSRPLSKRIRVLS